MKKALLTLLVILLAVTGLFAAKKDFDYGIDIKGYYDTTLKDDHVQKLDLRFLPYISSDNYKVQFRFDWDVLEGFKPVKEGKKNNVIELANTIAQFFQEAYVKVGKDLTVGIDRNYLTDLPFVYAEAEKNNSSFFASVDGKRTTGAYRHLLTGVLEFERTSRNEKFPVVFDFGVDCDFHVQDQENLKFILYPYVSAKLPVTINNHTYDFTTYFETSREETLVKNTYVLDQKMFRDWLFNLEVGTEFKKLSLDAWFELAKDRKATSSFTFGADAEYAIKEGKIYTGFELPFATQGNWGYITENGHSQDYYYFGITKGSWMYFGADLEIVGLAKALGDNVAMGKFVEPANGYVGLSGYVGFDTNPFDLEISANLTDAHKKDADITFTFNINAENFFSNK